LFGNLPYNIAATFIGNTIEHKIRFEKAVVTVQKEVALRMTANPGSKNYSSFSVLCQWAYDISSVMELSCGNFWPRPNVDSRSVLMKRKTDFPSCRNPDLFMKLQRSLFSSRRKTVKNNLSVFLSDSRLASEILEKTEIDPQARAETLSLKELLLLSDNADTDIIRNGI
jgi:16S rRNA (adenine1518-N6/adenine1519-N6)-dimethyltransferase